jgi:hypothetical protein
MKINLSKRLFALSFVAIFSCGDQNSITVSIPKYKLVGSWIYDKSLNTLTDSVSWCEVFRMTTLADDNSLWYSCSTYCSSREADSASGFLRYSPTKNGSWFIVSDSLIMTPSYTMCSDSKNQHCSTYVTRHSYSILKAAEDSLILGYWDDCTDTIFKSGCITGTKTTLWIRNK